MGGFASLIARLMPELSEVAARELAPTAARMAPETIESVSRPVLEEIMAKGGGWLSELLGREAPGAAMAAPVRAAAPTAARKLVQPEVSDPLYTKLGNFARQYLREPRLPGPSAIPETEAAPLPGEIAASRAARASTYQPPPEMAQMPSVAENVSSALQRPGEAESQEMVRRATEMEAGPAQEAAFARLKAILQRPGTVPSETQAELDRLMGREVPPPEAPADFPVLRGPYRQEAERTSTSMADLIRERGFKRPSLPPQYKELLEQLVASGKVPSDMLRAQTPGSEAMGPELNPGIMEKLFGSTQRALLGERGEVGSGSSTAGRAWAQLRRLSPEEIIKRIGKHPISPIMQAGQRQARAEYGAETMRELGEQRSAKDIVADLLRGGPSPTGTGLFSEKVLYPIMKARAARNLPAGQPLSVEDILGALSGRAPKFITTGESKAALPSTLKRKDFVMRVLKILQSMRGEQ